MVAGALYQGHGCCLFVAWAPSRNQVDLRIIFPNERLIPMEKDTQGYWRAEVTNIYPETQYFFRLDSEKERPDPASRFQPKGVHGPSQVVDQSCFVWDDAGWTGLKIENYRIYEIHTGTFTQQGTFDAIASRIDYLQDLGISAIELMPVAQFPGSRNWGYDGVYPYAVQDSYGGPEGLKRLVNICHQRGISVILDVVYNHLGPEGNYLLDYGPYFTNKYRTPWGNAINFDGQNSEEVRAYFIESALAWVTDYHIDALRIDAVHGIFDFGPIHFLRQLGDAVHTRAAELGRHIYVIPESDLNDVRIIEPAKDGGYGLDAQWNDDFHHCLHTLLTGEKRGYYEDFGTIDQMGKAYREGFVYSGQHSFFRKREHGNSSRERPAKQFIVFSQNHDQVGNRMLGDRLSTLVSYEQLKLATGVVLLSPFIPLLFMGEEYGETNPFQYFVSHGDNNLIEAVREGRKREFSTFEWKGKIPDPQAVDTFLKSKIELEKHQHGWHQTLHSLYKKLLCFRKEIPSLQNLSKSDMEVITYIAERTLCVRRWKGSDEIVSLFNFSGDRQAISLQLQKGLWKMILDSSKNQWDNEGKSAESDIDVRDHDIIVRVNPYSFILYCFDRRAL
jgi:maltooligosyltrehalose trehalohydrolase